MMDIMPNAIGVFINIVRQLPSMSTKGERRAYIMNRTSKKIESEREGVRKKLHLSHSKYPFLFGLFEVSLCNFLTHLCQRKKTGLVPQRRRVS